jgi:uncharacterized DUF497 family protein
VKSQIIGQLRSFFVMPRGRICSIVYTDAGKLGRAEKPRQSGEERWQTIGMVNGVLLILVAHTVIDEKEEVLRIISARRVTRQERIEYEEASEI